MKFYETIFILDVAPDVIDAEIRKVTDLIATNNGQVVLVDRWGMRKFAYEIRHKNQGFYTCIYFNGDEKIPSILENHYKLNENCLRYLTVVSIHTLEEISARAEKSSQEEPSLTSSDQVPTKKPSGETKDASSEVSDSKMKPFDEAEPDESLTEEEEEEEERKSSLAAEDAEGASEEEPDDDTEEVEVEEDEEENDQP